MVVVCDCVGCVVECSHVWWCVRILNGCGGGDGGARSAVPLPILDRFGPNKNINMHNAICKNLPYQTTNSEHTLTGNLI